MIKKNRRPTPERRVYERNSEVRAVERIVSTRGLKPSGEGRDGRKFNTGNGDKNTGHRRRVLGCGCVSVAASITTRRWQCPVFHRCHRRDAEK